VHDRGEYDLLKEGMAITIEPGIYIPENSNCDPKWWGIAVRIEDDYLLTKEGYDHLSILAPRKVEDIEAMMKLPSPLDDFSLPEFPKKK
jgi:Xaa-Pro aminopeptidase